GKAGCLVSEGGRQHWDCPAWLLAGEGVPGFERYFSGTPSPPLPRLYADNPDRGRAANCRGRGKNLEFAMELLLRERLLAPFARVRRLPAAARALNFPTGMRRRRRKRGIQSSSLIPTMISSVSFGWPERSRAWRYFGGAAAGVPRLW